MLRFRASNNEDEYEAPISDLKVVQQLRAEKVVIFSASNFVVSQIEGSFEARDSYM